MTSHELASRLLALPNLPVELQVEGPGYNGVWDAFWGSLDGAEVHEGTLKLTAALQEESEEEEEDEDWELNEDGQAF